MFPIAIRRLIHFNKERTVRVLEHPSGPNQCFNPGLEGLAWLFAILAARILCFIFALSFWGVFMHFYTRG